MRKNLILYFTLLASVSCIQTEAPDQPNLNSKTDTAFKTKVFSPESKKTYTSKEINVAFNTNLRSINNIEARTIYTAEVEGDFSKTAILTIQFEGNDKPTLKLYKDELNSGMNINLIPPNHRYENIIVRKIDVNNKVLSEIKMKLNRGDKNLIII